MFRTGIILNLDNVTVQHIENWKELSPKRLSEKRPNSNVHEEETADLPLPAQATNKLYPPILLPSPMSESKVVLVTRASSGFGSDRTLGKFRRPRISTMKISKTDNIALRYLPLPSIHHLNLCRIEKRLQSLHAHGTRWPLRELLFRREENTE